MSSGTTQTRELGMAGPLFELLSPGTCLRSPRVSLAMTGCAWAALGRGGSALCQEVHSCWDGTVGSLQSSGSSTLAVRAQLYLLVENPCYSPLFSAVCCPHTLLICVLSSLLFGGCRTNPSGFWTARDCELVYRNTTHVHCQCSQFGTFGVLMDSSHREVIPACGAGEGAISH